MMAAWLKRDVNSRPLNGMPAGLSILQRHHLGMRLTDGTRRTRADHLAMKHDHATNARVGSRNKHRPACQIDGLAHVIHVLVRMTHDWRRIAGPCISRMASTNSPISSKFL